jgi:hypothetical protein
LLGAQRYRLHQVNICQTTADQARSFDARHLGWRADERYTSLGFPLGRCSGQRACYKTRPLLSLSDGRVGVQRRRRCGRTALHADGARAQRAARGGRSGGGIHRGVSIRVHAQPHQPRHGHHHGAVRSGSTRAHCGSDAQLDAVRTAADTGACVQLQVRATPSNSTYALRVFVVWRPQEN